MSTIVNVLFPEPARPRTARSLLAWWESRRPLYNAVVGVAGLASLIGMVALTWLPGGPAGVRPGDVVPGAVAFGLAANVCYTLGWLVEMAAKRAWGSRAPPLGPFLFREGLLFSVGLTLLPLGVVGVVSMAGVVRALLA